MSTIDYSRFDKIGLSDDEDEDEEMGPPGVYRVGEGQSGTIPGAPLEGPQDPALRQGAIVGEHRAPDRRIEPEYEGGRAVHLVLELHSLVF